MKMAWPSPHFIVAKHIEQVFVDDLLKLADSFDQRDDGVIAGNTAAGSRAAPEILSDGGGKPSLFLGA